MSTKVKGLLRGLRYISQIFDEKEEEMQIGFPTDVKHVAHIGWDGPSANAPSWMSEFKSPPELSNGPSSSVEELKDLSTNPPLEDTTQTEKPKHRSRRSSRSSSSLTSSPDGRSTDTSKHSRRPSSGSAAGSPSSSPRESDAPKHSRRHRSSSKSADSQRDESSGSSRISRRHKTSSSLGAESPSPNQPSIPKNSRVRKPKGSSKSKEKSSSTENIPFSDPGSAGSESVQGRKNTASQLSSVLEAYEEEG